MHWKPRLNQAQNSISLRLKSAMWVLFDVSNKWNLKSILLLRQGIQQNFSVFFACIFPVGYVGRIEHAGHKNTPQIDGFN